METHTSTVAPYNFRTGLVSKGPLNFIRKWYTVDPSNLQISEKERLTMYQLNILSKSVKNYFRSLLHNTEDLINGRLVNELKFAQNYSRNTRNLNYYLEQYYHLIIRRILIRIIK